MTLTEFLLARIAEDEARAKYEEPHWADCEHFIAFSEGGMPCTCGLPARVLAECEAKRRIVAEHAPHNPDFDCRDDGGPHAYYGEPYKNAECRTLQLLAAVYAEHPDYRPEWAPDGMVG